MTLGFGAMLILQPRATAQWDYTLYDAIGSIMYNADPETPPCCFYSGTSFQSYYSDELYDTDSNYTVFVPTDAAVDEVAALMNLNPLRFARLLRYERRSGVSHRFGNLHGSRPAKWNGPHHIARASP